VAGHEHRDYMRVCVRASMESAQTDNRQSSRVLVGFYDSYDTSQHRTFWQWQRYTRVRQVE